MLTLICVFFVVVFVGVCVVSMLIHTHVCEIRVSDRESRGLEEEEKRLKFNPDTHPLAHNPLDQGSRQGDGY